MNFRIELFVIIIVATIIASVKIDFETETQIEKKYHFWKKLENKNYLYFFQENNTKANNHSAVGNEITNSSILSNTTYNISNNSDVNSSSKKPLKSSKNYSHGEKEKFSNSLQKNYEVFKLIRKILLNLKRKGKLKMRQRQQENFCRHSKTLISLFFFNIFKVEKM